MARSSQAQGHLVREIPEAIAQKDVLPCMALGGIVSSERKESSALSNLKIRVDAPHSMGRCKAENEALLK